MKRKILLAAAVSAVLVGCNQQADNTTAEVESVADKLALETAEKRVSYGMGVGLGERMAQESFNIDVDAFSAGVKHVLEDTDRLMTKEEIMAEMQAFQEKMMAEQKAKQSELADKNMVEGKTFLTENGEKEGVVTLDSGLQYSIITEGEGNMPAATDTVEVHYSGTLLDGTEFDSSYKRGSTVSFPVNGVIPGWTEALQLMPVGSKWQLYIPSDLAYGVGGTGGGPIGPNATLLFEVELVAIKKPEPKADS